MVLAHSPASENTPALSFSRRRFCTAVYPRGVRVYLFIANVRAFVADLAVDLICLFENVGDISAGILPSSPSVLHKLPHNVLRVQTHRSTAAILDLQNIPRMSRYLLLDVARKHRPRGNESLAYA